MPTQVGIFLTVAGTASPEMAPCPQKIPAFAGMTVLKRRAQLTLTNLDHKKRQAPEESLPFYIA